MRRSGIAALTAAWVAGAAVFVFAHGGEKHRVREAAEDSARAEAVREIAERYRRDVEPLFKASCFDCHTDKTRYPWYYRLPFVRGKIDRDVEEAREHLDMGGGFPFEGHGSPEEDLKAIREVLEEGEMPPWEYRLLHWGSGLTGKEKRKIYEWVEWSLGRLEGEKGGKP